MGVPKAKRRKATTDATLNHAYTFIAPFGNLEHFTGSRFLPSWDAGGAAMVHRNFVRLTSDSQGHRGWITSQTPNTQPYWSMMLKFRVSGRSSQLFGDGLALWYTKNDEHVDGDVFGREDYWDGLGIFFDTFQNIDKSHIHRHPYISAIHNDGTKHYIPEEGAEEEERRAKDKGRRTRHAVPGRVEGSGCSYDFRFSEARDDFSVVNATFAHIVYSGDRLTLHVFDTESEEWLECIDMAMPELPTNYYFGLSAATGDLVDNHDVLGMVVHGASSPTPLMSPEIRSWAMDTIEAQMYDVPTEPLETPSPANYLEVISNQASEIQSLRSTLAILQHRLEYELSSVHKGLAHAKEVAESGRTRIEQLQTEVGPRPRARGPDVGFPGTRLTACRRTPSPACPAVLVNVVRR